LWQSLLQSTNGYGWLLLVPFQARDFASAAAYCQGIPD
jgi:hypothetical protein